MKPLQLFRITHVDAQQRRRTLRSYCTCRDAAEALAVAQWGPAVYMAAMRLTAPGGQS